MTKDKTVLPPAPEPPTEPPPVESPNAVAERAYAAWCAVQLNHINGLPARPYGALTALEQAAWIEAVKAV